MKPLLDENERRPTAVPGIYVGVFDSFKHATASSPGEGSARASGQCDDCDCECPPQCPDCQPPQCG